MSPERSCDTLLSLQRPFLCSARRVALSHGGAVPPAMQWLCHPLGHRFFVDGDWAVKGVPRETIYSSAGNPGTPLPLAPLSPLFQGGDVSAHHPFVPQWTLWRRSPSSSVSTFWRRPCAAWPCPSLAALLPRVRGKCQGGHSTPSTHQGGGLSHGPSPGRRFSSALEYLQLLNGCSNVSGTPSPTPSISSGLAAVTGEASMSLLLVESFM